MDFFDDQIVRVKSLSLLELRMALLCELNQLVLRSGNDVCRATTRTEDHLEPSTCRDDKGRGLIVKGLEQL